MALSEAKRKANDRYIAKAYGQLQCQLPKADVERIKAHVHATGESLAGFIKRACFEALDRDQSKTGD